MPKDPPIVCTLDAAELPERLAEMRALGEAALVSVETQPARAVLRFVAGAGIRTRVEEIAAAEARCCAFLTMAVDDEQHTVRLTIDAPADAESVLADLVDAFRGHSPRATGQHRPADSPAHRSAAGQMIR